MTINTAHRKIAKNFLWCITLTCFALLSACSDNSDKGLIDRTNFVDSSTSSSSGSASSSSSGSGAEEQELIDGDTRIILNLSESELDARQSINISIEFRDSEDNLIPPVGAWQASSNCSRNFNSTVGVPEYNPQSISFDYTPITCVGEDTIEFTVAVDEVITRFERTVTVAADTVNQIVFIRNEPELIALKGSGLNTQANVTFQVKGVSFADGIPDQLVEFALEGGTGGMALVQTSALTDENGMVTARVQAGTVPGIVVVKASHTETGVIASSEYITVSTGYAYPEKFRIAASVFNPNAKNKINGEGTSITVALSDRVGNAVADGTRVRFYAEAGRIPDVCETTGGTCSVTWASSADEPDDGRVQIFASTKGIEDFVDQNNNFVFDDGDDFPEEHDLNEPFLDADQDGVFDQGDDILTDTNNDKVWSVADGLWNGPNCQHSALCSDVAFADLGAQLTIYTSDDSGPNVCRFGDFPLPSEGLTVTTNQTISLDGFYVSDGNMLAENEISAPCAFGNPLPNGTTLTFTSNVGAVQGVTTWRVPKSSTRPFGAISLNYKAPSSAQTGLLTLTINIPSSEINHYIQWPIVVES